MPDDTLSSTVSGSDRESQSCRRMGTQLRRRDRLSMTTRRWLMALPGAKNELGTLIAVLVFAGLALAFGMVANEMNEGETHAFDNAVIQAMRNPSNRADPIGPPSLEIAARDITGLGGQTILTLVSAGTVGFLLLSGARAAALLVVVAVMGGAGLVEILKQVFGRVRPDFVAQSVYELSRSFPSGHSTLSAVTYL